MTAACLPALCALCTLRADDWEIPEAELQICHRPDGSEWLLGEGRSGKVLKGVRGGVQVRAVM